MDFQYGSGINSRQANVDAGYNNYNSSGAREEFPINKGNEGVRDLQQIPVGKAFRGEVTDVTGRQVTIRLDNGQSVQARLAEPMSFNIGQKVLFQIKSNSEGMIEIKPLANGALQGQEATILKALEAANLPVNEKTVLLLQNLLKEQMPIDRSSLQNFYKQILANGNASLETIIQMNKNQIPVTKENIGQFEAYKNYEHRIAAEVDQLSTELTQLLSEIADEDSGKGRILHMQLLQLFAGEIGEELPNRESIGNAVQPEALIQDGQVVQKEGQAIEGQPLPAENTGKEGILTNSQQPNQGAAVNAEAFVLEGEEPETVFVPGQTGYELSAGERQEVFAKINELPIPEELKERVLSGEAQTGELVKELHQLLQQNPQMNLDSLIHSDGYKKLLKSHMNKQWFVKPEQLAAGKMEEFYEKLHTQTRHLEQLLESVGKETSQAAKTAGGIRENIDFMNQLNQMFTYVQIPLMMSGKTAHSDLYVFTKKKNLKAQEGKVSALLHLDMENLGCLDVYVEMDGMDVKTQFKLADEELVGLFEKHIDFLTKRIVEKGYRFSSKVEIAEKPMDFVEDFLERGRGNAPMQRFAFDVRA